MPRWPAEWEPHAGTAMCWPLRAEMWRGQLAAAERAHAEVADAIARFEPVTMIAAPRTAERAAAMCGAGVEVVELPIDDSWFRDSGPIYVIDDGGGRVATDWRFNAWGDKFVPYDDDALAARRFADLIGDPVRSVDMVFEGGSITGDGEGTVVTTTQCLMHPNRNPTMTKVEIEAVLRAELGTEQLLWLPHGLALDDDTDGHVDNIAAFAAPGQLVLQGCDDTDEDDWLRLDVDRRVAIGRDRCPRTAARRDRDPGAPVRRGRRRAGGRAVPQLLRRQRLRRRADVRPPRRRRHGGDDRRPVPGSRDVRGRGRRDPRLRRWRHPLHHPTDPRALRMSAGDSPRRTFWQADGIESVRVDQWLWSVRLTKTRADAAAACRGGHVKVNGKTAKPATTLKVGDRVEARLHDRERICDVTTLVAKRVGAPIAETCFVDHSPPPPPRDEYVPLFERDRGAGRPTKRDRRQLDRLRGRTR